MTVGNYCTALSQSVPLQLGLDSGVWLGCDRGPREWDWTEINWCTLIAPLKTPTNRYVAAGNAWQNGEIR
jgi:hypothetical protein